MGGYCRVCGFERNERCPEVLSVEVCTLVISALQRRFVKGIMKGSLSCLHTLEAHIRT